MAKIDLFKSLQIYLFFGRKLHLIFDKEIIFEKKFVAT